MHDSCVVVSLLKAIPIVLTAKILAIFAVAKGLAPWASVWCGGEWANAYPVIALGGGSYKYNVQCTTATSQPGVRPGMQILTRLDAQDDLDADGDVEDTEYGSGSDSDGETDTHAAPCSQHGGH